MIGMRNKKRSKLANWLAVLLARAWHVRYGLTVAIVYGVVFGWLFSGTEFSGNATVFEVPDKPLWSAPAAASWFGKTGSGADLFELSRAGMASSVGFALVTSILGIFSALMISTGVASLRNSLGFRLLKQISFNWALFPAFLIAMISAGGSGGNIVCVTTAVSIVISLSLLGTIGNWLELSESGGDVLAGLALGMSRPALVWKRSLPVAGKKCLALIACLIPLTAAVEMALSFLGFLGDRISCGRMISLGRDHLFEAPWLAVYPGILATLVLIVLSVLGWFTARLVKVTSSPKIF